jgi:hypothetical protein
VIKENLRDSTKIENAIKWINQLTGNLKNLKYLPHTIAQMKSREQANHRAKSTGLIKKEIVAATQKEHEILDEYLHSQVENSRNYYKKSFAAAIATILHVDGFKWAFIQTLRVKHWQSPDLFIDRDISWIHHTTTLNGTDAEWALRIGAENKAKNAFLFSKEPDGAECISYHYRKHFYKTISRRLFGRHLPLSAFRKTNTLEVPLWV